MLIYSTVNPQTMRAGKHSLTPQEIKEYQLLAKKRERMEMYDERGELRPGMGEVLNSIND